LLLKTEKQETDFLNKATLFDGSEIKFNQIKEKTFIQIMGREEKINIWNCANLMHRKV
jgi:hypothetical protein